jgi:hypothetical protein
VQYDKAMQEMNAFEDAFIEANRGKGNKLFPEFGPDPKTEKIVSDALKELVIEPASLPDKIIDKLNKSITNKVPVDDKNKIIQFKTNYIEHLANIKWMIQCWTQVYPFSQPTEFMQWIELQTGALKTAYTNFKKTFKSEPWKKYIANVQTVCNKDLVLIASAKRNSDTPKMEYEKIERDIVTTLNTDYTQYIQKKMGSWIPKSEEYHSQNVNAYKSAVTSLPKDIQTYATDIINIYESSFQVKKNLAKKIQAGKDFDKKNKDTWYTYNRGLFWAQTVHEYEYLAQILPKFSHSTIYLENDPGYLSLDDQRDLQTKLEEAKQRLDQVKSKYVTSSSDPGKAKAIEQSWTKATNVVTTLIDRQDSLQEKQTKIDERNKKRDELKNYVDAKTVEINAQKETIQKHITRQTGSVKGIFGKIDTTKEYKGYNLRPNSTSFDAFDPFVAQLMKQTAPLLLNYAPTMSKSNQTSLESTNAWISLICFQMGIDLAKRNKEDISVYVSPTLLLDLPNTDDKYEHKFILIKINKDDTRNISVVPDEWLKITKTNMNTKLSKLGIEIEDNTYKLSGDEMVVLDIAKISS